MRRRRGSVVLDGSNGQWAGRHYRPWLVDGARSGALELWASDLHAEIRLDNDAEREGWSEAAAHGHAHYIAKRASHWV
ncbi:MAG: hypothetical protein FJ315_02910 [SAR202 cluster bacterium]|nr:hypothetical protein [SAR202 cluster bacterium]